MWPTFLKRVLQASSAAARLSGILGYEPRGLPWCLLMLCWQAVALPELGPAALVAVQLPLQTFGELLGAKFFLFRLRTFGLRGSSRFQAFVFFVLSF